MDVEAAHAAGGKTRFDKALSILVGVVALLGALLATLQQDASRREERAMVLASRLSVDIFEQTAGSGLYQGFRLNALRDVTSESLEATTRGAAALGRPGTADAALALADAQLAAQTRMLDLAREMGRRPTTADDVDPHTVAVATAAHDDLIAVVEEQGRQVDAADRQGQRGSRTVLALSLLAIAAALLALAGVSGRGRVGRISASAAVVLVVASAGWGASALLL